MFCFFFFQAEDGIRDLTVTGVQTCALPISSVHRHLGEEECEHCKHGEEHEHGAEAAGSEGHEREMLPWFKLAATLDPERPETYVVASFWLTKKLGKFDEAERFLREGLRANPGNYEILYELGRIAYEH